MHSFFSNKGDEALAQVAQRGGGCPKVRGWGYEHLMELWVSPCIAEELDQMAIKDPFHLT